MAKLLSILKGKGELDAQRDLYVNASLEGRKIPENGDKDIVRVRLHEDQEFFF